MGNSLFCAAASWGDKSTCDTPVRSPGRPWLRSSVTCPRRPSRSRCLAGRTSPFWSERDASEAPTPLREVLPDSPPGIGGRRRNGRPRRRAARRRSLPSGRPTAPGGRWLTRARPAALGRSGAGRSAGHERQGRAAGGARRRHDALRPVGRGRERRPVVQQPEHRGDLPLAALEAHARLRGPRATQRGRNVGSPPAPGGRRPHEGAPRGIPRRNRDLPAGRVPPAPQGRELPLDPDRDALFPG